ncbi:RidA family protein [Nocardiopsis flavescens]|uniref:Enamine deaminase RidA, house cleaning of reactive enamine intermediates, YjgF/YER057c/UK114 family n=1 Tax=Nocardiopsis flavescens TaxID=758803 RepID=A0A1M6MRW9_9ACTN|nr:RidA family protein [Nocardiopsis flavescens]SHJ86265.1 Enamine deaminase RidA, house cleaning of reactive enamine intermediates, YjgF/YER057c/UK114 family [Nocardiopsis flavescens]
MPGITHLNPAGLHTNPAFSQGVRADGGSLVVVGGQNGTGGDGAVVPGGLGAQTVQAFRNVLAVLAEAGADQGHVVKLTVHLKAGEDVTAGYRAAGEVWGPHPTAITVLQVAGFARPDALVEIDALAVVP